MKNEQIARLLRHYATKAVETELFVFMPMAAFSLVEREVLSWGHFYSLKDAERRMFLLFIAESLS